jgi:hypothetical protein
MTTSDAVPPADRDDPLGANAGLPSTASARGLDGLPLMGGGLFDDHPIVMTAVPARSLPPSPVVRGDQSGAVEDQRRTATRRIHEPSWLKRLLRRLAPRR